MEGEKVEFSNEGARLKDLTNWYSSSHWGWDSVEEVSYKTSWCKRSKPIIFSEFGFRSIECATNTPGVYGDEVPKYSSGTVDFLVQMRAIRATPEHINESESIAMGFCYGWDSRGLGWQRKFADGAEWAKGHWIDGKIIKSIIK